MLLLIKKATILCTSSKVHLKKKDLLICDGIIEKIGENLIAKNAIIIDKKNTYISTGWIDLFADFCDPGFEQKEDLESGSAAAVAGGYTDVCLIPNTFPSVGNKSAVDYFKNKNGILNLHPLGAISKNIEGKDLAEMYDMRIAGAVAFTDGNRPLQSSGLMLKALQYIKSFNGLLIQIPDDLSISKHGLMNEGIVSTKLGLQGKPAIAESILLKRDLALLKYTQSKLHVTGISTKESVDLIRQAKKQGLQVSCSVTPYHLLFTETQLETYQSLYKVQPPLRTEADRLALLKGIHDGTVDCIASHHSPHEWDAKEVEFEYAKDGMIGLQTMLPALLKIDPTISIEKWVHLLSEQPRRILGLTQPLIEEKATACLTIFNQDEEWDYNDLSNKSKSKNTPFYSETLIGKVLAVVNNHQLYIHE